MFGKRKRSLCYEARSDRFMLDLKDILANAGRAEFEAALSRIRVGHGYITPEILLLQLQFATIDPEKIRGHIMEFDTDSIGQALDALIVRGLQ